MKHSKLTTVLIFFLPSDALMRHLLSAGSKVSVWPFRGIGLVLPSSGKIKKKHIPFYLVRCHSLFYFLIVCWSQLSKHRMEVLAFL